MPENNNPAENPTILTTPLLLPPAKPATKPGTAKDTQLPRLVYGTAWKAERTADLVYEALRSGFRAIDTAAQPKHYREDLVGEGIRRAVGEGIVKREEIFIQTKFTPFPGQDPTNLPYNPSTPLEAQIRTSIASSLQNLATPGSVPYIDSLVLHSPLPTDDETLRAWRTLESYVPHTIRRIGISNTSLATLEVLYESAAVKPFIVQNRLRRGGYEPDLYRFCASNEVVFQPFWVLTANPNLVGGRAAQVVSSGAGVSREAAVYVLLMALGRVAVLDGTKDGGRMKEDVGAAEKVAMWAGGEGKDAWGGCVQLVRGELGL